MKNKTTIAIVLGIFLLSFASAMYAGNCEELDASDFNSLDNIVYTVVGNSSNLEGLNISVVNSSIQICPAINYKSDNFTLIFFDNSSKEVIKEVIIHKRGRTKTKIIYENVTEYVEVEKIKYIEVEPIENLSYEDKCLTDERCIQFLDEAPTEEGFFKKIWNWFKGLFKR